MGDIRGKFLWYEHMTIDVEAAKAFYSEVVGWKIHLFTDLGQPYPMLMAGDAGVGGIAELPKEARDMGAPPHWFAYIGAPDVDATVAKAKEMGATVYAGPMDIPKIGRLAVLADPQGAVFGAYAPEGEGSSADLATGEGRFSWNELMAKDVGAAWTFYSTLFGWAKHEAMDMGEAGVYQMYGLAGSNVSLGGFMQMTPEMPFPPHWVHYAHVADLDRSVAETKKRGGQVLVGPMEVPGGDHVAVCMDPQGAAFAMHGKG